MVYFRITDGCCRRKFWVNSHGATFQSLKEKVSSLFPDSVLLDYDDPLHFHYYNEDGKCTVVATDTEFQNLLSAIPEDTVWKFHVSDFSSSPCKIEHIRNKCKNLKLPPLGVQSFPFGVRHSSSPFSHVFSADPFRNYCFPSNISLTHPAIIGVNSQSSSIDCMSGTTIYSKSTSPVHSLVMANLTKNNSKSSCHKGSASALSRSTSKTPSSIAKMSVPTGNLSGAVKRGWNPSKSTVLTSTRRSSSSRTVVGSMKSISTSKGNITAFPSKVASTAKGAKSSSASVRTSGPACSSIKKTTSSNSTSVSDAHKTASTFTQFNELKDVPSLKDKLSSLNSSTYPPDFNSLCSSSKEESAVRGESTGTITKSAQTMLSALKKQGSPLQTSSSLAKSTLSRNSTVLPDVSKSLEKIKSKVASGETCDIEVQSHDSQKSAAIHMDFSHDRPNTLCSEGSSEMKREKTGLDQVEFTKPSSPECSKHSSVSGTHSVATVRDRSRLSDNAVISARSNTSRDKSSMSKASLSINSMLLGVRKSSNSFKLNDDAGKPSENSSDDSCTSQKSITHAKPSRSESNHGGTTFPSINSGVALLNQQSGHKRLPKAAISALGPVPKPVSYEGKGYGFDQHNSSTTTNTDQLYLSIMSNALSISDFDPIPDSKESLKKQKEVESVQAEKASRKGGSSSPVGYSISLPSQLSSGKTYCRDTRSVSSIPLSDTNTKDNYLRQNYSI